MTKKSFSPKITIPKQSRDEPSSNTPPVYDEPKINEEKPPVRSYKGLLLFFMIVLIASSLFFAKTLFNQPEIATLELTAQEEEIAEVIEEEVPTEEETPSENVIAEAIEEEVPTEEETPSEEVIAEVIEEKVDDAVPTEEPVIAEALEEETKEEPPAMVVKEDRVKTNMNTDLSLTAEKLLENDSGNIRLLSVTDAFNGTVNQPTQTEILFTPKQNFIGTGGFQYIISDEKGNTDKGQVWVEISEPLPGITPDCVLFPERCKNLEYKSTTKPAASSAECVLFDKCEESSLATEPKTAECVLFDKCD